MKKQNSFQINKQDFCTSLFFSFLFALIAGFISFFLDPKFLEEAFLEVIGLLSTFSLTFLGFLLTAFTFMQILQSKEWFDNLKGTKSFSKLLCSFKILILGSMFSFFIAFLLKITIRLICCRFVFIGIIVLSAWFVAFLVIFAWKTVSAIIELFKV